MTHVEDKEFVLRLDLRCNFPEGYDGDADGHAWLAAFKPIAGEIVAAAAAAFARHPGWRVRAGNRGRPTDDEVTLVVERVIE